jgi:hypothetical protein
VFNHGLGGWLFARVPTANDVFRPKTQGRLVRFVHHGSTYSVGRNIEKRKARADAKRERAIQVDAYQRSEVFATPRHAPKCRLSALEMDMLADRRLRQRGVSHD